jgi:hypothetical protein
VGAAGEARWQTDSEQPRMSITHDPTNDRAVLLLDKRLIIFAIRPTTREHHTRRLTIIAHGLIHKNTVVVGIEAQQIEGQQLSQLRQHFAEQLLLPDQQRCAFGPPRGNVSEHQRLDEAAIR